MGWFNRLVIRNGTIGLGIVLRRIRFAEATAQKWESEGQQQLAAKWRVKRNILERRFHAMHEALNERIDREVATDQR